MESKRVIVVGGGIAGLAAAYFLRRAGMQVTVLEADDVGSGASSGNAGWICPAQSGPLPEPGLATYGIKSLFNRDSALYIAPSQLPHMMGWLVGFARHCNASAHRRGTEALARLGRRTFVLSELLMNDGVQFESYRQGMLVVAERPKSAEAFLQGLAPLRNLGFEIPRQILDERETRGREPMLSEAAKAGIFINQHLHVRPMSLVKGLASRLDEMGVDIERGSRATDVLPSAVEVRVTTQQGAVHRGHAAVIAAGAWTSEVCRQLGVRLPIVAGKGYSFDVPLPNGSRPRSAMLLLDAHVGCSPFSDQMRVAGTMEFSGINSRIDPRRVAAIARGAKRTLPMLDTDSKEQLWTGMRPIAPDGLPVVDRLPGTTNVYVASAYSMLGMTLAAPAGEALAEMITTGRQPEDLFPFRIGRFRGVRLWRRSRQKTEGAPADVRSEKATAKEAA